MEYRRLGKTGREVSVIGFGAWAIGADWGAVDDADSLRALHAAADAGVTLIDTADVYGDGHSEQVIRRFLGERPGETFFVATKMGRRVPLDLANYTPESFRAWTDRSRENLGMETLDLVQLHCLHPSIYYSPEHFAALDELVAAGAIRNYGVSVEKVEEALKAIEFPGVATVQIIFNMFRQRPAERFLAEAARRDVGVLARVPLASGMLTGKLTAASTFEPTDHRQFNRHGESFDVGETFAGVDYETGLEVVESLKALVPEGATLAQLALRWILMHDGITATIPGAKTPEQAAANAAAADLRRCRPRRWPGSPSSTRRGSSRSSTSAGKAGRQDHMAVTATYRVPGAILTEREHRVPLDHPTPDGRFITVFTREVADPDGPDRPYLVFLQGGPGHEAARPTSPPSGWLKRALAEYRVLLLDQRGTGRSTPVGERIPGETAEDQAAYLALFRADAIVRDCEWIRRELGVDRWTTLGQSFGGFTSLTYLSFAPEGLAAGPDHRWAVPGRAPGRRRLRGHLGARPGGQPAVLRAVPR